MSDPIFAPLATATPVSPVEALATLRAARDRSAALPHPAPAWLHANHAQLLGRVLHGIRTRGTALLAAPTGHGKTWIALAVHVMLHGSAPACVIVPASLRAQWRAVAHGLGMRLDCHTHERASRAALQLPPDGLVIVDEAHRFRTRTTRRHRHLADALTGRRVLLLSATPVVNRLDDLAAILSLAAPDDLLARAGIPSLQRLLGSGHVHPALERLIHLPPDPAAAGPRVVRAAVQLPLGPERRRLLTALDSFTFSTQTAVAALLHGTAVRALASSTHACRRVLQRYARLLAHAKDAAAAGRVLSRGEVLRATSGLDDQLLFWSLLPAPEEPADLALEDAVPLAALLARTPTAADDLAPLTQLIRESSAPTIVFTAWRATAHALVERLGPRTAWCTGSGSGIGVSRLPREAVLSHFRGAPTAPQAPTVLIATDVAAEGLDLPRLRRVLHADLPWTPMRLVQREGRARRAGSSAACIEVITVRPPRDVDRRLGIEAQLQRKSAVARRLTHASRACQWALDLQGPPAEARAGSCWSITESSDVSVPTALCAFLDEDEDLTIVGLAADGARFEQPTQLNHLLRTARTHHARTDAALPDTLRRMISSELRRQLSTRLAGDWALDPSSASARLLSARVGRIAEQAARLRDAVLLARCERVLRWCGRGHTAADRQLTELLLAQESDALEARLASLDGAGRFLPPPAVHAPAIRLVALLCFIPPAHDATFGACPTRVPCSSISMAPSSTASA